MKLSGREDVCRCLKGVAMQHDGRDGVRCVMRQHHAGLHSSAQKLSPDVTATLGGRKLCIRLMHQESEGWASLHCGLQAAEGDRPNIEHYQVSMYAVGQEHLQRLARGMHIKDECQKYMYSFVMKPFDTSRGQGVPKWAQLSDLAADPAEMYVIVDVQHTDAPLSPVDMQNRLA